MAERDTLPPTSDRLATPPRHVRHVIAVGGGRGGVGKSVLTVNLGVYLAQLGRTVVVVDADPAGAELHTMLGIDLPEYKPTGEDGEEDLTPLPTPVPGLMLLPQLYSVGSTVPIRPGRKPRWARRLRQLDDGAYLELVVKVDKDWQRRPASLDRLGL